MHAVHMHHMDMMLNPARNTIRNPHEMYIWV